MKKLLSVFAALLSIPMLSAKVENKEVPIAAQEGPKYLKIEEKVNQVVEQPIEKKLPKKPLEERIKDRVVLLNEVAEQRKLANGAKEFFYGDVKIIARDKENADRKARNKGLI